MEIKYERSDFPRCLLTKCSLHNKITKTPPTLIEGWSIGNYKSRDDTAHNVRRAFRKKFFGGILSQPRAEMILLIMLGEPLEKKFFGGILSQPGLSQEHLSLNVAVTAKVQQPKTVQTLVNLLKSMTEIYWSVGATPFIEQNPTERNTEKYRLRNTVNIRLRN